MAGPAGQLRQGPGQLSSESDPSPVSAPVSETVPVSAPMPLHRRFVAHEVPARDLTIVGGAMLAAAYVLPALPGHPGLPCPLRTITGVPCPMCGMTTSVEATVHLDLAGAFAANPAGIILVVVATVLLVTRPRAIPIPRLAVTLTCLAAMWVFELHRFGFV